MYFYFTANDSSDGFLQVKSPLPSFHNTTIRKVELWMEFQSVRDVSKVLRSKYYVDILPANESKSITLRDKKRPQFRDSQVEMNFNITVLFMNCKKENATYLEFKLRLLNYATDAVDKNLKNGKMEAFILLHEFRPDDIEEIFRFRRVVPPLQTLESITFQRPKRDTKRESKGKRKGNRFCKLKRWYVTFDDMGWDWVIAPPMGFTANLCTGSCTFPLVDYMNATNHAIIQTLRNSIYGKPRKACCAPKEMEPLTVIFMDGEDIITLKKYPDMVVKSCACL